MALVQHHVNGHRVGTDARTGPVYERLPGGGLRLLRAARPVSRIFDQVHAGGGVTQIVMPLAIHVHFARARYDIAVQRLDEALEGLAGRDRLRAAVERSGKKHSVISMEAGVDPAGVIVLGELTPVYVLVSGFTRLLRS